MLHLLLQCLFRNIVSFGPLIKTYSLCLWYWKEFQKREEEK